MGGRKFDKDNCASYNIFLLLMTVRKRGFLCINIKFTLQSFMSAIVTLWDILYTVLEWWHGVLLVYTS